MSDTSPAVVPNLISVEPISLPSSPAGMLPRRHVSASSVAGKDCGVVEVFPVVVEVILIGV